MGQSASTLCLVLEEVIDFAGRAVVRDDVEALVVHVEDEILALCCWGVCQRVQILYER